MRLAARSVALLVAVMVLLLAGTVAASKRPPADDPTKPPPPRADVRPAPPPLPPQSETPLPPPPPPPPSPTPPPKPETPGPKPEVPKDHPVVALAKEPTPGGLMAADFEKLLNQGHALKEILEADAIAGAHGVRTSDLLEARKAGKTWGRIIAELPKRTGGAPPISIDEAFVQVIAQTFGLTDGQVWALIARGYSPDDIGNAKRYADKYGLDMERVLKRKGQGTWSDLARKLGEETIPIEGLTQAEVHALGELGYAVLDIAQAAEIAKVSKLPVAEILALRGQRDWLEVARELLPSRSKSNQGNPPGQEGGK